MSKQFRSIFCSDYSLCFSYRLMNRFTHSDCKLRPRENLVTRVTCVSVCDGSDKPKSGIGEIILTSERIIWKSSSHSANRTHLELDLRWIMNCKVFSGRRRILLHFYDTLGNNMNPSCSVRSSSYNYVTLLFSESRFVEHFYSELRDSLHKLAVKDANASTVVPTEVRAGIISITQELEQKVEVTNNLISDAFSDLRKLMSSAENIIKLAKNISQKIFSLEKEISDDEIVQFRSILLGLSVSDPVMRKYFGKDKKYYEKLAVQISDVILSCVTEKGGVMSLVEMYCRVNRARCVNLLSPEDIISACEEINKLSLPVYIYEFESGVRAVLLSSINMDTFYENITMIFGKYKFVTSTDIAHFLNIPITMAKQFLLTIHNRGLVSIDHTIQGLYFYPNYFLQENYI